MSIYQFAEKQHFAMMLSGVKLDLGSFSTAEDLELRYIRVFIHVHNLTPTTEQVRLKLSSDSAGNTIRATSDYIDLSDLNMTTAYWVGFVRFDFNRENIDKDLTYYLWMEGNNYNQTNTSYVGAALDYVYPVYTSGGTDLNDFGIKFEIYGDRIDDIY